ncbi:MAG: Gfo/Idh/MocA family oxidoreductase [Akkermansia sp.]|nr:Gfo/Idh/MocA family oxidoreductase [Akkermansia sp.]
MTTNHRLSLVGIGCGSRTRTYMKLAMEKQEQYRIVAAADPVRVRAEKVRDFAPESERATIRMFSGAEELLSQPRLADVAIIGTQDDYHYGPCKKALEIGYNVLLEKPIAKTLREALELRDLAGSLNRRVVVCHVLRYTQFYRAIKKIIDSGEIGEVITFNANEGVGAFHFAHSFVRGHWGNSKTSTPMIVAKCCHDMDILYWLMGRKCLSVASFGELTYFTKKSLAKPRSERCVEWESPVGEDPYDARRYTTEEELRRWLAMVYDRAHEASVEEVYEWLKTSPWGRDQFQCDNNQPDHQVAIMNFEGGLTGTFTMTAFEQGRHIEIYGTKGKIRAGVFYKENGPGEISVTPHFGGQTRVVELEDLSGGYQGHGGGDWGLMESLYSDMCTVASSADMTTSIEASAHSHVMAFAVEHARLTGQVVNVAEFEQQVLKGELNY